MSFYTSSNPCGLGVIRGIGGPNAFADSNQPTYERHYSIGMTEIDTGTDQSAYKGYGLEFDMVFRADVAAQTTCPSTRVNGICTTPVYERNP
jgi:hypothetical protein